MDITFHTNAFEDYVFFQQNDKKLARRINELLKDIARQPFSGIGKPEALHGHFMNTTLSVWYD